MVVSSSRWNPYWLLVALCSATRERADRMRAPVSVTIILLQTGASRMNSLFASKARQCYIVHCVEHQRNHREARITRAVRELRPCRFKGRTASTRAFVRQPTDASANIVASWPGVRFWEVLADARYSDEAQAHEPSYESPTIRSEPDFRGPSVFRQLD